MQRAANGRWKRTGVENLWLNRNGFYYARYRVAGKPTWKSLRTKLKSVAVNRLRERLGEVKRVAVAASADDARMSFGQVMDLVEAEEESTTRLKPRTKKYYRECRDLIKRTWEGVGDLVIRKVPAAEFVRWANRLEAKYSPTRYNNTLSEMRKVIRKAVLMGILFDDPTQGIRKRRPRKKVIDLPDEETFNRWLEEVDRPRSRWGKRSGQTVRFLAFSGTRRLTEAANVRWQDVDFKGGFLVVRGDPETGTKNWEIRKVPLNDQLRDLLQTMRSERPGEPKAAKVLECVLVKKQMDYAADAIGMKRLKGKDLRDWFGTRCVESGVDIPTVAEWMGHKDGGALLMKTYNHLREEHSLKVARRVRI
jgi:integrase